MKYNGKIIPVFMKADNSIQYTTGDVIFGINSAITGNNPNVMLRCIKDQKTAGSYPSDQFTPYQSAEYEKSAKTKQQYFDSTDPNQLVAIGVIKELFDTEYGVGRNADGKLTIVPNNTDLNTLTSQCRYKLNPSYTYRSLPTIKEGADAIIFECTKASDTKLAYQMLSILYADSTSIPVIYIRTMKMVDDAWVFGEWITYQCNEALMNFNKMYTQNTEVINESFALANSLLGSINDSCYKIEASIESSNPRFPLSIDITDSEPGYYHLLMYLIINGSMTQYSCQYCSEDVDYMKFNSISEMQLALNDATDLEVKIDNGETISIDYIGEDTVESIFCQLVKIPLKLAEDD